MKLSFRAVIVVNFKSYLGAHIFEIQDYGAGLHFVRGKNLAEPRLGSNGAGKSSIWDALVWCLFGKTVGGLKNPDVKPWNAKVKTSVSVELMIDGKVRVVSRMINPNRIEIDGKEVGQQQIETLIGMNFDMLTNTLILGQGQPLFFDLEPRQKMDLFVGALSLDRWEARAERAAERAKQLNSELVDLDIEAASFGATLKQIDAQLSDNKARQNEWADERAQLLKRKATALRALTKQLKPAEDNHGAADLALEGAEVELRHYQGQVPKLEQAVLDAEAKLNKEEMRLDELSKQHDEAAHDLQSLGAGDECPTCGQSLKGTALAKHKRNLFAKVEQLQTKLSGGGRFAEYKNDFDTAKEKLSQARAFVTEFRKKATDARDTLDTLTKTVADLRAGIKQLSAQTTRDEEESNPFVGIVRNLRKDRKNIVADIEANIADHKAASRSLARTKFWIKGFKDVRLYVLEEVLLELEMTTNGMIEEAGLVGWSVAYQVERETKAGNVTRGLSIMIRSPRSKGMVKWESWSGGEAQRLRIIGTLALSETLLNRAGIITNMEVLDEPTQHLSTEGVNDLCDYLADRARRLRRKIFYLDQVSVESSHFDTVTTIKRTAKGSSINGR